MVETGCSRKRHFVKFCTTCGEVYPSDSQACTADGSALKLWTRRSFDTKVSSVGSEPETHPEEPTRLVEDDDRQAETVVHVVDRDDDSKAHGKSSDRSGSYGDEATRVEATKLEHRRPTGPARGKRQHLTDVGSDIGEHTDVVEIGQPATLHEFDAGAPGIPVVTTGNLVVYDHESSEPFEGMLIGNRYRLESRIGTGGFGVVFDATDKEENKRVAIKILSPALSQDRRTLARFRREAIAASRIQHPGIIKIDDFGIEDEGVSYIVMEFLPGHDVAALLEKEGKLAPRRAANLIMQCAEALFAAHQAGVLHRDLKPANIFVIEEHGEERVKIIDFGIAKDFGSNPRTADLTSASKVVGTPYYMSPEQARGVELDGRADIYSLGIILFELLTGRRPFEAPSVLEILMAHSKAPRVRPSTICPELASEAALEDALLKAMQAKSKSRFADMNAFAKTLASYLHPETQRAQVSLEPFGSDEDAFPKTSLTARRSTYLIGSRELTKRHNTLTSKFPLPLWTAVIPAMAVVLVFSLLSGGSSDKPAKAETTLPLAPSNGADLPVRAAKAAEQPATDVSIEFEASETEVYQTRKTAERPSKNEPETTQEERTPRKSSAAVTGAKSKARTSARTKDAPQSEAISEW